MKHVKGRFYCLAADGEYVFICKACGISLKEKTFNTSNGCRCLPPCGTGE